MIQIGLSFRDQENIRFDLILSLIFSDVKCEAHGHGLFSPLFYVFYKTEYPIEKKYIYIFRYVALNIYSNILLRS